MTLYADDILWLLAQATQSIGEMTNVLREFGGYSGLKINWGKSIILPLDDNITLLDTDIKVLAGDTSFKYLGINILRDINRYESFNLTPLIQTIRNKLKHGINFPYNLWSGLV